MISRNTDKLIGQTFDNKYRIIELIDRGAMGSVYKAEHVLMGRIVALKVIRAGRGEDEDIARYLTRFEREARTTSQIDHPNAITIHDYGVDGDVPYLVMQYLEGTSLKQELTKRGRLSFSRTADIVEQVAGALDAAHKLQIIHRDLKPENIMLRRVDGVERVEVLDFGIAKVLDDESAVSVTGNGDAIGTPQYMSPEAVQGEDVGPASDIYALAVVAYEMLTGRVPFQADTAIAMLCKHVIEEPPPMRSHCKIGIPEQADEVILRALSKSPAERPTSALAFAAELRQALNIGSSQYEAAFFGNSASAIPKHRSAPALLAAIGLLMVLAGTAFYSFSGDAQPEPMIAQAKDLLARHKFAEAKLQLTKLLATEPSNAEANALLGDLFRQRGDVGKALLHYRQAVRTEPDNPEYKNRLESLAEEIESKGKPLRRQIGSNVRDKLRQGALFPRRQRPPRNPDF